MKIAITSQGKGLNADVSCRFWRCPYFIIYDTTTNSLEEFDNNKFLTSDGVGIQAARILKDKGINTLLTGKVEIDALKTLSYLNIDVYANLTGTVMNVLDRFRNTRK